MDEHSAFLGAVMAVINPEQFNAGVAMIDTIHNHPQKVEKRQHLAELLRIWTSPLFAVSLMNNRDSPLHRDTGGGYSCMDLLTTVGNYTDGRFQVPSLGYEFWYDSGTVMALAGRIVRHGATSVGDRLCVSYYVRENVLRELSIPEPDWIRLQDLIT